MKRIAVIVLAAAAFGCTKKMSPAKTEEKKPEPTPTVIAPPVAPPVLAPKPETGRLNTAMLAAGQKTYEGKCGRCHELFPTTKFTQDRWVGVVNWMAPKARLDSLEKSNVLAYVQHNAIDAPKDKAGM